MNPAGVCSNDGYMSIVTTVCRAESQEQSQMKLREQLLQGKRAALFDMDGTLIESMGIWGDIDVEFLGERGIEVPVDLQKNIEGMSFSETAQYFKSTFDLSETEEELKVIWNQMAYDKYRTVVPMKAGAFAFLQWLKDQGYATAVCTSNSRELIDMIVENKGIRQLVDFVVTACEVNAGKPAPDIYLRAAEVLGVKPSECVVFEDIPAGLLAGIRAGMTTCAVEDSYSVYCMDEKRQMADFVIHDFMDLLD